MQTNPDRLKGSRLCCSPCPRGPHTSSVTLFQRDRANGRALRGVVYTLTGDSLSLCARSDAEGMLTFCCLPAGCYRLCETEAPDGYRTEAATHTLTVGRDGTVLLDGVPAAGASLYHLPKCREDAAADGVPPCGS